MNGALGREVNGFSSTDVTVKVALMPMPAKMSGARQPITMVWAPPEERPATYTCFGSIAYCGLLTKRLIRSSRMPEWPVLRLWVLRHGVIPASRGGKLKTALQTLALGLAIMPLPPVVQPAVATLFLLAVVVTVVTGLDYVAQAVRLRRAALR